MLVQYWMWWRLPYILLHYHVILVRSSQSLTLTLLGLAESGTAVSSVVVFTLLYSTIQLSETMLRMHELLVNTVCFPTSYYVTIYTYCVNECTFTYLLTFAHENQSHCRSECALIIATSFYA
jgi:hypothetical protein